MIWKVSWNAGGDEIWDGRLIEGDERLTPMSYLGMCLDLVALIISNKLHIVADACLPLTG